MFESALLRPSARRGALSLGYMVDAAILVLVVLAPLIRTQTLPEAMERTPLMLVPAPPPPAAPGRTAPVRRTPHLSMSDLLAAPTTIPKTIPRITEAPVEPLGASPGGVPGGVPWTGGSGVNDLNPPPPPAPPEPPPVRRVRLGGEVEAARAIFRPAPEYPAIAIQAHVEGTVRLEAVIGSDGVIKSLRAVSGPPLLVGAAIAAVSRWRYQPTLLDGNAVEVSTVVEVNFTLNQ